MIDFDVETTGLQPWSQVDEAFLWIFEDDEGLVEVIPFTPSGDLIPGWNDAGLVDIDAQLPEGHTYNDDEIEELAQALPENEFDREGAQERIQWWFDRARTQGIRAHNAKFDRAFAEAAGCFDVPGDGLWHDSMVVAHSMDERRSVALKSIATSMFGDEAAAPQKALKDWLNAENRRRAALIKDAEKARVGKYVVPNEKHGDPDAGKQNKNRPATEQEVEELLAEAAHVEDGHGSYRRANYSHVPASIMEPYAAEDVILTRKISDVYEGAIETQPDIQKCVEFERGAFDALYAIEKRGLPVREGGIEYRKLEMEVVENLERLGDRVHELALEADPVIYAKEIAGKKWGPGGPFIEVDEDGTRSYSGGAAHLDDFNPNSSAQILACLKARGADMTYMSEKDGKVAADKDNLQAVDDELAAAILEFRSEAKVHSTYVKPMIDRSYVSAMNVYKQPFIAPDSRIHANYRQVGARTGRMSCSDPNMQNQPRDDLRLRYNIVADPGHVLITCDLTNIEMYLFAAYCGEGRLLDAVRKGDDIHTLTAKMLGLRDRKRPGGGIETARQLGKTYNFSRVYGGGLRTIRRQFRCSLDEARLLKRRFDDAYPEVQRLQNRIEYNLYDQGYIQDKLISGRRFRVEARDAYKATNYLVQGTAASLLKLAITRLHQDGAPMVALVHDEIVLHCPIDEAKDWAALTEKHMTTLPQLDPTGIKLSAEADIVTRWSDAKPLKEEGTGRAYFFDPVWAEIPRRYVDEAVLLG